MKAQHTLEPWRWNGAHNVTVASGSATIACSDGTLPHETYTRPDTERIANARLIDAAPELFEALERLLAWADMQRDSMAYESARREIGQARVAIAKATGKQ